MKKQIIGLAVCATILIGSAGMVEAQYTIAIDPGYTGCEVKSSEKVPIGPGASKKVKMYSDSCVGGIGKTTGIKESDVNLGVGIELRDILEESGYNVIMLREDNDTETGSQERAIEATESGADIFVRLYCRKEQKSSKRGAMVYLPSESNPYIGDLYEECDSLGRSILESYCDYSGFQNSGIKYTDETVGINWSGIPVAQVMLGCISDSKDEARLADSDNWDIMAEGIAAGIEDYLDDESDFVDEAEVEGWDDYSEDEYEDYEDYDENGSAEQEGGLTEEQAYDAVYQYADENYGMDTVEEYHGYLTYVEEQSSDEQYTFVLRSYTGAYVFFYVDANSGETYSEDLSPITDEMENYRYVCNAWDYQ